MTAAIPTDLRAFTRHAEKFGVDCVYETATDFLSSADLARLKCGLRDIAKQHRRQRQPSSWWSDVPAVAGADVQALVADGLTAGEAATLTGWSRTRVERALSKVTQVEESLSEPHNHAGSKRAGTRDSAKTICPSSEPRRRPKRRGNNRDVYSARLRRDVATLHERGLMVMAIADEVGVTDATVRKIVRELASARS